MARSGMKDGRIVLVSSTLGYMGLVGYSQYTPMKHAIRGKPFMLKYFYLVRLLKSNFDGFQSISIPLLWLTLLLSFLPLSSVLSETLFEPSSIIFGTAFPSTGLADSLRSELLLYGIKIHAYFPGTILSPGFEIEQKTKPRITKEIEGKVEALSCEDCAKGLMRGELLLLNSRRPGGGSFSFGVRNHSDLPLTWISLILLLLP